MNRSQTFGELPGGVFERVAPGYFPEAIVREHESRYRWASRYVADKRVLDVGCGTAYGCSLLARSGARRVTGVDIALPALEHGKQTGVNGLVCANILQLPFGPSTFDVITCFEVIEHVVEQAALLKEMSRLLVCGGIVVLSTPNRNQTSGTNPYHLRELFRSELLALVAESGLRLVKLSGQHWVLRPEVLRRVYGIRRAVYTFANTASVFRIPEIIAEPSVYVLAARKEQ